MAVELMANAKCTIDAVDFFERYKESFGNVIGAEMVNKLGKGKLILTNDKNEQIIFKDGLNSGYPGEGPKGTNRVLKECGFDIADDFVFTNPTFKLVK